MTSIPVWLSVISSALFSGEVHIQSFLSCFPRLAKWIMILGLYLLIPAVLAVSYGANSWQIALLGSSTYMMAFLMLIVGWRFPQTESSFTRLFTFYGVCTALMLIGGPLDYLGFGERFTAIGTSALGALWVTYRTGEAVYMFSGFFRGPDIMGWHAVMLTMVSSFMALRSRGWVRGFWIALSIWGILNVWICGRRKMISMLPFFWGFLLLLIYKIRSARRAVPAAGMLLVVLGLGWYGISSTYHTTAVDRFYLTTLNEWDDQLSRHGVGAIVETVKQSGFWGYGLGMSQQGLHHIQADKPRIWQESGPSKIFVEMGVPGAFLLVISGSILLLTAYQVLRRTADSPLFYIFSGLFAVLGANLSSAFVSAQIFGDPLVSLLLAFFAGIVLSGARTGKAPQEDACLS
jgi:hypothetical protein